MVTADLHSKVREDFEAACDVIAEIIRQSPGDEIEGKTRLFKAFYFAHLFYATSNSDYLTEWPIVKMPNGPGIDRFDQLVSHLQSEGIVAADTCRIGPYQAKNYRAVARPTRSLPDEAVAAIKKAIKFIAGKTGAQLSDLTHEYSRTWNETDEHGKELPIYLDLLTDDDYQKAKQSGSRTREEVEKFFGE